MQLSSPADSRHPSHTAGGRKVGSFTARAARLRIARRRVARIRRLGSHGCPSTRLRQPPSAYLGQRTRPTGRTNPTSSHHGSSVDHLPAKQEQLELVSRLELNGAFGDVQPAQIADVAVAKGYAYLNSWDNPDCERGGTYVVDIRKPAEPREAGFIPAQLPVLPRRGRARCVHQHARLPGGRAGGQQRDLRVERRTQRRLRPARGPIHGVRRLRPLRRDQSREPGAARDRGG